MFGLRQVTFLLSLMFGQNQVSNSWDIADVEFLWSVITDHFHVNPT